jgi:thioredoxin reductase
VTTDGAAEKTDVIVIGAGPAGLATAAALRHRGVAFVLLERADHVGASWERHYDRLHLHTDKAHSNLPHQPMPKEYPRYPSRDEVVWYLQDYASRQDLQPVLGVDVTAVRREGDGWRVEGTGRAWEAPFVVVATGVNGEPHRPSWPGFESFEGPKVHSAEYKNGAEFAGQDVLVVGFGNSGGEIAIDLAEHGARPAIAVRSPVNVLPKEIFGMSILALSKPMAKLPPRMADALNAPLLRLLVGDITKVGLKKSKYGPMEQIAKEGRMPLLDIGTMKLLREGKLRARSGIKRFEGDEVLFDDGKKERFDAVVLATGYRPRLDRFLDGAEQVTDGEGWPTTSGDPSGLDGLFFCGMYVSPRGMIYEMAEEALRIAARIARKS